MPLQNTRFLFEVGHNSVIEFYFSEIQKYATSEKSEIGRKFNFLQLQVGLHTNAAIA